MPSLSSRTHSKNRRAAGILLCFWLAIPGAVAQLFPGTGGDSKPAEDPTTAAAISQRLETVAGELAAAAATDPNSKLISRLHELRELLTNEQRLRDGLAKERVPATVAEPRYPRDTVFALNDFYEQRFELLSAIEATTAIIAGQRKALADARAKWDDAERKRRESKREAQVDSAAELTVRKLDSRIAAERVNVQQLELHTSQRELELLEAQLAPLDAAISSSENAQKFKTGDASAGFAALAEREGRIQRDLESLKRGLASLELRLSAAQKNFAKQGDAAPEQLAQVEALSTAVDTQRQQIQLLEEQLQRIPHRRETWQLWQRALLASTGRQEMNGWIDRARERIEFINSLLIRRQGRMADLRKRSDALTARLDEQSADPIVRTAQQTQLKTMSQLAEALHADEQSLLKELRLNRHFLSVMERRTLNLEPSELVRQGYNALRRFWAFEITAVQDEPITVGSIFSALLLAGLGVMISRRLSGFFGRVAKQRLKLDHGAVAAIETLTFYILLVGFTLLALRSINFPLTAFTVLGGALAIGVGFGSQNIMNNFISGLILMLERPVRAQDVVEVDGNHGTIEKIGARSTQIRSTDGRQIIVPNSFFLESNVINWTLSDDLVRAQVGVGVAYGSPMRRCEELLRKVVNDTPEIISQPAPIIIFDAFGDNSLNFEIYFWVHARSPMQTRIISSKLRFAIDDIFHQNGIVIAFPQRDVHLDAAAPLDVRLVGAADSNPVDSD